MTKQELYKIEPTIAAIAEDAVLSGALIAVVADEKRKLTNDVVTLIRGGNYDQARYTTGKHDAYDDFLAILNRIAKEYRLRKTSD